MKQRKTNWVLWIALAVTLLAVWFAPREQTVVDVAKRPTAIVPSPTKPTSASELTVKSLRPRDLGATANVPFASPTWAAPKVVNVEAKKPQLPDPVPAPKAPPLPFRAVGSFVDHGKTTVFLQHNESTIAAVEGAVIVDQYRVEHIGEREIVFVYLPLDERQSLAIERAN